MSRTLFENSKAALAFAGMTILGAVAMVGTSDGGGVLDAAVDRFGEERANIAEDAREFAEERSVGDAPSQKDAGWGNDEAVFGDFTSKDETAARVTKPVGESGGDGPMDAPLSDDAVVVEDGEQAAPEGVPVITDRELTIEPQ